MAAYQDLFTSYLNALPPTLAIATLLAVVGWKFWLKNNGDVTSDKAFSSVSTSYKTLSDAQQARILQQDVQISRLEKLIMELQIQLAAALAEIQRVGVLLTDLRASLTARDKQNLDRLGSGGE